MEFKHYSVMLKESIDGLNIKSNGIYFDGTLGGGGHSYEILKRSNPSGRLIATDLDEEAISAARVRLKEFSGRFTLINSNYKRIKEILENMGGEKLDGAILDLGVSSYQLDNRERGFSYMADDVRLDMRMNKNQPLSAYEVVNELSEEKLYYILDTYGEEKFAKNIAKYIVERRAVKPIETTGELSEIIDKSIPYKFKQNGHPSKKSFQAIRIFVNEEIDGLDLCLRDIVDSLKVGGRLAVITFHSLEDRVVKQTFKDLETDCICDKRYPCVCGRRKKVISITKKPITASEDELSENKRSASAKLRIIEKV